MKVLANVYMAALIERDGSFRPIDPSRLLITARHERSGDEDTDWCPVGVVQLIDTHSQVIVRIRYHGPSLLEICPEAKLIGSLELVKDADGNDATQEIVAFDPKLFRLYLTQPDGTKELLEVV
ncbi:MAG: hypothetical protein GYA36_19410 [Veillonellaceae bacterium]|nr:hypothetical protein [Veillonellaceae bacterium]